MALFWEKGYQGASLADLTMAMGINSPSLYAAFHSKANLFHEAVSLYWQTEGARVWDGIPKSATARDAIDALLRATATGITRPGKPRGCLVILGTNRLGTNRLGTNRLGTNRLGTGRRGGNGRGANRSDEDGEMVGEELRRLRVHMLAILRERLERAAHEGELPADVDTAAIAAFYSTVHQGLSLQARDGATRKMLLEVVACAMAAWDCLASSVVKPAK